MPPFQAASPVCKVSIKRMIVETLYLARVINCVLYHFYPANSKKVISWEGVIAKASLKKKSPGRCVRRTLGRKKVSETHPTKLMGIEWNSDRGDIVR